MKKFMLGILALIFSISIGSAQNVIALKAIGTFKGELGDWGVRKGKFVQPAKGYKFYAVADAVIVVLPQEKSTPKELKAFIQKNVELQVELFGESYETFAKKGKKKGGKPKPTLVRKCESVPNCNYTCYALFSSDGRFLRCGGNCCAEKGFQNDFPGTAVETIAF